LWEIPVDFVYFFFCRYRPERGNMVCSFFVSILLWALMPVVCVYAGHFRAIGDGLEMIAQMLESLPYLVKILAPIGTTPAIRVSREDCAANVEPYSAIMATIIPISVSICVCGLLARALEIHQFNSKKAQNASSVSK
jgi:hypothetical protein